MQNIDLERLVEQLEKTTAEEGDFSTKYNAWTVEMSYHLKLGSYLHAKCIF